MMDKNDDESNNRIFDKRLRKFENKIVNFLLDIGQQKRVNPKFLALSIYLLIHGELTQKELKELTGFSAGTISTYLSVMLGFNYFSKKLIPNTHTYIYYFSGDIDMIGTRGLEIGLKSFALSISFLKNKKKLLEDLSKQSKNGANHISQRIDEIINVFKIYEELFPTIGQQIKLETEK